ncbi:hypothetical protein AB0C34_17570 [Nocardia sp. NPDC049220]|uniref:hypothetical protein n=1 Tax=Nocardia sp. NPDC049220 TaxID=3155273 RepID=UPI0033CBA468
MPSKRKNWTVDPVAIDLIEAAAKIGGISESAVISRLARRHLATDYPPLALSGDDTAAAVADLELEETAARIDEQRGYRAAG